MTRHRPPEAGVVAGFTRVSLTLTLVVDAVDSSVSTALGWTGRRVPGAEVTIRRTAAPVTTMTATTDTLGTVRFDSLLTGNDEISALRALTVAEMSRLAPADGDVDAVAAGGGLTVGDSGAVRNGVPFLADRVDIASLPLTLIPDYTIPHLRIPAAAGLDVAAFTFQGSAYPACPHIVHSRFLRQSAPPIPPGNTQPQSSRCSFVRS